MMRHLLLIDDDAELAALVSEFLGRHGFRVDVRGDVASGRLALRELDPDALILDLMLPDGDGFDFCRELRASSGATSRVPIVMLTARGEATDRIVGLELGADDYLPKPFEPRELLARLRAVLRRGRTGAGDPDDVLRCGRLEIDRAARRIRLDGEERQITGYQFDLLLALAENAGRVMSRDALMDRVRGMDHDAIDRTVDVHVSRLRAAIEDDPKSPRRILTVRGAGYLFARRQD